MSERGLSRLSRRVVEAVADEKGVGPTDVEPLYSAVDPECLDDLFRDVPPDADRNDFHVAFTLDGCRVRVSHDGVVDVSSEPDSARIGPESGENHAPESPE